MHKAPLVEAKQIEHVSNERAILGELAHPFLVGLVGAYQDDNNLYLLQVRAGMMHEITCGACYCATAA